MIRRIRNMAGVVLAVQVILVLAVVAHAQGDLDWSEYVNVRYGYTCAYPTFFTPQREADNGDGREFRAPDRNAEAACWGAYQMENSTAESAAVVEGLLLERGAGVTYKRVEADWFVLSGFQPDGRIYYRRSVLRGDVLVSFLLVYPEKDKDFFDPVVQGMSQGLGFVE